MTETEARAIAAPDSWPWPMSQEAQRWVIESLEHNALLKRIQQKHEPEFNRAEHERFMKELG